MRKATLTLMGYVEQTDGASTRFRVADIWFNLPESVSTPKLGQFVKFSAEYRSEGFWVVDDEIIRYDAPDMEKMHREADTAQRRAGAVTQQVLGEAVAKAASAVAPATQTDLKVAPTPQNSGAVAPSAVVPPTPNLHTTPENKPAAPSKEETVSAPQAQAPVAVTAPAPSRLTSAGSARGFRSASSASAPQGFRSTGAGAPPATTPTQSTSSQPPAAGRFNRQPAAEPATTAPPPAAATSAPSRFSTPARTASPVVRSFTPRAASARQPTPAAATARPAFDPNDPDSDIPF